MTQQHSLYAEITGWGKCIPPAILSNDDISRFLETSDEWIRSRTGIHNRRISHVPLDQLCTEAGRQALACAGLEAQQLDAIIVCTCTPSTLIPNVASAVQQQLGAIQAAAFDLNAACSGFVYGLQTASALISSGAMQRILLIGGECLSQIIDWTKRDTAVLFGDGAGAVILEQSTTRCGLIGASLGCDSQARDILAVDGFGTDHARFSGSDGLYSFNFEGREIFKRAVIGMDKAATAALRQANIADDAVNFIVPHQANLRIIDSLAKRIGASPEQVMVNIQNYGNTSAATIPIALTEALEGRRIHAGDHLLLAAFGAGLTWGAAILRWGERTHPINDAPSYLAPCTKTALELIKTAVQGCKDARGLPTNTQLLS
jgi:3-oxoacyl-[acyl-carrier-protein] synthase-3